MECIERGFKALDLLPQLINQMEKELDQSATHDGLKNCELIAKAKGLIDA
jgi:hypothetical protein